MEGGVAEKPAAVSSLCRELGSDRTEVDLSVFSQRTAATSKQFAGLRRISGDPTINLCRVAFSAEDLRRVCKRPRGEREERVKIRHGIEELKKKKKKKEEGAILRNAIMFAVKAEAIKVRARR